MRPMSRIRARVGVLAAILLAVSAVPGAVTASGSPGLERPHCASLISPPDRISGVSSVSRTRCFRTMGAALRHASGSTAIPDRPARHELELLVRRSPAAAGGRKKVTTIIGIHWEHADRGGRERIYFVKGAQPCANGRKWQISKLDGGWDRLVSAAEGFGGCTRFVQFEHVKHMGASQVCSPYCANLGPLNDQVSAIRWRA
jgi:hypothetical protein